MEEGREEGRGEGGRERSREGGKEGGDGSPIEMSSHKIMDLLFCFGMKVLKLMHSTVR